MSSLKILVIATSLRKDSISKKIARIACKNLQEEGCIVSFVDLADYPMPVYNQDIIDQDVPQASVKLKALIQEHNILVIATPEHNFSMAASTKNMIDWVSRTTDNKNSDFQMLANKLVGLISASPSNYGGYRALRHLGDILREAGCVVSPGFLCIANSFLALDEDGNFVADENNKQTKRMLAKLIELGNKL